jgi:hypothetical protein
MSEPEAGPDESRDFSFTLRRAAQVEEHRLRLVEPGGSGTSGGGMDPWQQSVENRLAAIDAQLRDMRTEAATQFRWLVGLLITIIILFFGGFGSLLGVMAKGFGWL